MFNARLVHIDDIRAAKEEIRKIGAEATAIPWMYPKAMHLVIKLEGVNACAANILKQEMLGEGGDAAVHRGVLNASVETSDVLLMGTYKQYSSLLYKLSLQKGILQEIGEEIGRVLAAVDKGRDKTFNCGKYKLPLGEKTYIMGILNVTPDSFSDGGKYTETEKAVAHARAMVKAGADIIDVGGESTRPGHQSVDALDEISRIVPVVERLVKEIDVPVSVDTSKALVAAKALEAGAHIINDVWGLQRDPEMAATIARYDAGVVMMHNSDSSVYSDVMGDIIRFLADSAAIALNAGIDRNNMMIDPGIGFGKTLEQNLEVMRRLRELRTINLPVLLGTSRKSLIGNVLDLPVGERLEGTAATVTLGIAYGVDVVRVHDVNEMARVVKMTDAMVRI